MVATVLALATLGMMIPGAAKAAVFHTLATEGSAVALSALAPDKCNNRERDGERRPNHACENIERGLSAHDAPHCTAEQRLPSLETYARGAILFLRALTHAFLTRLTRLCAWPEAAVA